MTLQELQRNTIVYRADNSQFKVEIERGDKTYYCTSKNMKAYHELAHYFHPTLERYTDRTTARRAFQALYNECKNVNNLR